MTRTRLAALVACTLLSPPLAPTSRSTSDVPEIRFSLSAEARDVAQFRSFIDPDARFTGNEVLRGPDAVVAAWGPFFQPDGPRIKWRPQIVEVLDSGNLALTRGPYRLESTGPDGKLTVRWGTFNSVWRLAPDGQWRVVFDTGGPPIDTPTDESRALLEADTSDCSPQVR